MMQYKGIKGQWSFFFFKDTWKRPQISMFNSNSVHRESLLLLLYWSTPARGKGRGCAQGAQMTPYVPTYPVSGHPAWAGLAITSLPSGFEHRQGNELIKWETDERLEPVVTHGMTCAWTLLPDPPGGLGCQDHLPLCHPHSSLSSNHFRMECVHHVHKNFPFEL